MTIKSLWQTISQGERKFLVVMALIMVFITTAPYLYGYFSAGKDQVYTGLHSLAPGDIPVYYSYINQVKAGSNVVKDLFTGEPQRVGMFNAWWWWIGKLAVLFDLSAPVVFQLSRVLVLLFFVVVAYLFVSLFFVKASRRKLALLFILFSAGLGFYFAPFFSLLPTDTEKYLWPIDLWLTEGITFNALYHSSHFIASLMFSLAVLGLMVLALENNNWRYGLIAGFLSLFYFNFHPFYAPVIYATVFVYLCYLQLRAKRIDWQKNLVFIVWLAASLPMVFYHWWLIISEPVIAVRALQNITTISPFIFVLIGYGFLWLGGVVGVVSLFSKKGWELGRFVVLLAWLAVNWMLIYSPLPFSSRYIQGTHIILSIFTVYACYELMDYLHQRQFRWHQLLKTNKVLLVLLFVLFFSMSLVFSVARDVYYFTYKPGITSISMFIPKEIREALQWLKKQDRRGVVMAEPDIMAKFIPAFSQQMAFAAHGIETIDYQNKLEQVEWFWSERASDKAREKLLEQAGIKYVFFSPYEKMLGSYDPASSAYLDLVFHNELVSIYMFKDEANK